MLQLFQDSFIFGENLLDTFAEQLLQRNSYFFGVAISSEHLLFLRSSFFRTVTSLQHFFFQSEISTEQPPLKNTKFFRGLLIWGPPELAHLGEIIFIPRPYGIFYLISVEKFVMSLEKNCLVTLFFKRF